MTALFANAQMDSKKLFQFHRPRTEVQPSPFIVVARQADPAIEIRKLKYLKDKLVRSKPKSLAELLKPMAKSNFNCAIATPQMSDRTNSISRSL